MFVRMPIFAMWIASPGVSFCSTFFHDLTSVVPRTTCLSWVINDQGLLANAQVAGNRCFGTAIDKALLAADRVPGTQIPKSRKVVRGWVDQHLDDARARQHVVAVHRFST